MKTHAAVIRLDEFVDLCESGSLTDLDGVGFYGDDSIKCGQTAYPSDIVHGNIDKMFSHV